MTVRASLATALLVLLAGTAAAQPTYKLDVKAHLKPLATLTLDGATVKRTEVRDDPGFRLQYHFKKDGKTLAAVEARANLTAEIPDKAPGTYTVALELFYPNYKGGNQQKGEYRAVTETLVYRVEAGPDGKPRVAAVEPVLVIECGKGKGTQEVVKAADGYGCKLLDGEAFDGWPEQAVRTHCWQNAKQVRLEVTLPAKTAGTLQLLLIDGDGNARKQRLLVQGQAAGEVASFGGAGKRVELALTAEATKAGKVEIALQNLNPTGTAVISAVVFTPH